MLVYKFYRENDINYVLEDVLNEVKKYGMITKKDLLNRLNLQTLIKEGDEKIGWRRRPLDFPFFVQAYNPKENRIIITLDDPVKLENPDELISDLEKPVNYIVNAALEENIDNKIRELSLAIQSIQNVIEVLEMSKKPNLQTVYDIFETLSMEEKYRIYCALDKALKEGGKKE